MLKPANMRYSLFLLAYFSFAMSFAQNQPIGIFDNHSDIGNPKIPGSVSYDASNQVYTMKGSGYNIWFNRDEFQYLYKKLSGDFILTANFEFLGDMGKDGHRKMGWMVRESTDEASAATSACTHVDGLTVMQWRGLRGAYMRDPEDEIFYLKKNYGTIQLERNGKRITMRVAHPGEPLQIVGYHDMTEMKDTVLAGLFLCAHDPESIAEAKMWNVRIDKPVSYTYNPSQQGWLGCRLEIMQVADGARKVIHESKGRFEAPNWMPDGKSLLFNENGSLYTISVEGGTPEKLNSGAIDNCNNDHGISFDGKLIAFSSHRAGLPGGGSSIYIMPIKGGEPKLIVDRTPSYWHGWSPTGKEIIFVAMRDSKVYNIYKVAAQGGPEIPLTNNMAGHVDGPEFAPDGKYIYYNANQTGTMQIWRMKPDGTEKEQLTFDEYHNWFPHISPDGKSMIFISFPPDIDPAAHPSYKRVMLRLMSLKGANSLKVIAYLFGGQGTINVPSWSPDSKYIAFVSNSEKFE